MPAEPIYDIAHLGHLELLTPKFEESRKFFIDVMGMTQSGEKGDSVYLRGWDDYERYSLKLTASKTSGMAHVAFRTRTPQALERRAAALKGSGFDVGWSDGDLGHGKTFVCKDPDGHTIELYYETEWYDPPPDKKPALKNQAERYPARGCNVRRIDHFNGLATDIKANREFFENYLGFRLTEQIVLDDGTEAGMWMTATNKSYDFAYTRDHTGTKGRFHHVTYALDAREDILRAADIFLENGIYIETGPHKHAIQQTFFLYVYEPGGNRVEVACAGARLVLAPDWKPIVWTEAERKKGQAWGLQTIKSFHTKGTPPVPGRSRVLMANLLMTRRNTPRISFIGFGEAGQAIASGLRDEGIERIAAWDILFPESAGAHLKAAGEAIGVRTAASARRCGARNRHGHLGGDGRIQPGGGAFGGAASDRQSLLSGHQFGIARPQTGNGKIARRAGALCRCGRDRADPPGPPSDALADLRWAGRGNLTSPARTGHAIDRRQRRNRLRGRDQDDPQRDDQGDGGADARMLPRRRTGRRAGGSHGVLEEQLSDARLDENRRLQPRADGQPWRAPGGRNGGIGRNLARTGP